MQLQISALRAEVSLEGDIERAVSPSRDMALTAAFFVFVFAFALHAYFMFRGAVCNYASQPLTYHALVLTTTVPQQ